MCGIFGAIRLDGAPAARLDSAVSRGIEMLRHRGPDASGVEVLGSACFGHARLSIIDLEGGVQPMRSFDAKGLLTYNGEIYNFLDLRAEMEKLGDKFSTHSDVEVTLAAYRRWGSSALDRFRGMFAFAAIDAQRKTAILARDRLGKKPLFYTEKDGVLWFSSELEPLYRLVGPFKLNEEALDGYLNWQYISAPLTIYKGVRCLPPAHRLEIDLQSGNTKELPYWKVEFTEDRSITVEDWERMLDDKLREAVSIRLVSDVPFGAFLSGGIDSSLVVGYMAEILEKPVKTFSIGFQDSDYSELEYAEQVARQNKTEHYTKIVEADSIGLLPTLVRHYGQPFADSSAIPTYHVSKMAREKVKMALSGDGGDESFAGYHSYESVIRNMDGAPDYGAMPSWKRLPRVGYHFMRRWLLRLSCGRRAEYSDRAYRLHCQTAWHFMPHERSALLRPPYRDAVKNYDIQRRSLMGDPNAPIISQLQRLDLLAYLPYDILTKVDIASMANSLEVRAPLLDHELVEMAARIPSEHKLRVSVAGGKPFYDKKYLLKQVAKRRYPAELIDRRKMGFGVPLGAWFATTLKGEIHKRLLGSETLPSLMDMEVVRGYLERHSESNDLSARIWNLLFLEAWLDDHRDALK